MERGKSLQQTFGDSLGAYAPSLADVRVLAVSYSPLHYEDGDMRRAYRWTRAALLALLVVGSVALLSRLVLTSLFVTFVSTDPLLVGVFNAAVTVLGSGAVFALMWAHRSARRRLRYRRARRSARPDRL